MYQICILHLGIRDVGITEVLELFSTLDYKTYRPYSGTKTVFYIWVYDLQVPVRYQSHITQFKTRALPDSRTISHLGIRSAGPTGYKRDSLHQRTCHLHLGTRAVVHTQLPAAQFGFLSWTTVLVSKCTQQIWHFIVNYNSRTQLPEPQSTLWIKRCGPKLGSRFVIYTQNLNRVYSTLELGPTLGSTLGNLSCSLHLSKRSMVYTQV